MTRARLLALVLAAACVLCLIVLRGGQTQSGVLRRVTNTTEEGINLNPSISGDGRIIAFESTEDIAGAGGADHFRAIRANVASDPATFFQMGGTRAVAPAVSQDGSRIAFASKDDPLGANLDGNSEIFLLDGSKLNQVTNTSPGDVSSRVTNGNFQPSISDDGRFIAFSSNRNLAGQNSDGNLEIFIYDALAASFTQLTNSTGMVGASDAKISGSGAVVAYIRDTGGTPSARRDLVAQPRFGLGPTVLLAGNVLSLAMTYGRAISDDGTRVVYAAETATNTTQVFLFDGRGASTSRQITSLAARVAEVPLHPTISGDGTRIAFSARRSVAGAPANSDGGVELYVFDIPTAQVSKITNGPASATADVVSSLSDDGSVVAFNFSRVLSGAVVNSELANDSEIYMTGTPTRLPFGAITVLNGASFGKEPSTTKAVAPESIAIGIGGALANSTQQSQKLPNGTFPTNVGGTMVTVNGRAAQIFFVSPGQVNFLVPPQTEIGTADVVITNSENFTSRGTVPTLRAAPGVFTRSGDGSGPGVILNNDTLQEGPFDPSNGDLRLTIFTTGARNAAQTVVGIGGRVVNAESVIASPDLPGLDEVRVLVPRDLRGAGAVDLFVQSDGRASNPVAVTLTGDGNRDILINEALSDPPDGIAGDANHDGVRDSGDDEFVELINTTTHDIDISGYQLLSRSSSTTSDSLRHTFAAGTILPGCSAAIVFGGGLLDPNNQAFGGALVVKATSGGLSLTNGGGVVTLRDSAGTITTSLTWGGSTGLNGDANQSMTRAPDVTGNFVLQQAANGNGGRSFSPGTRVDGSPFAICNPFVRIEVTPTSATVDAGAKQQFTAKAFNAGGNEVSGVIFSWQSRNTAVATIDQNGLATSSASGSTNIRASARGIQSAPATLTVRDIQRVLTRIDVAPPSATIPASGAQQFTAHGIDQFGNEMTGLTFTWESTNTAVATIDQTGLAGGVAQGQSTIKATSQSLTGTATLNVTPPTIVVNEVLADPPTGNEGDANHDGTRDSGDDEFVELVNATNAVINISEWTVRTHSTTSSTETVRHTFAANTTVPAGEAMVVFGGGTFDPSNPLFGCAQVVKTSTAGLSLTNSGLTILVRDGSGNLVAQFSYGGATGLNGGNAQSLTRSPDVTGNFVLHNTAAGASGRKLSPGLKVDGTPFGNCPGHPASVTIAPSSTTINVGQTTQFTAQAFDQFGRTMIGVAITFASDNAAVAPVDSVTTNPSTGVATATVSAHNPGTAHITATATDGTTTANSSQATLTVSGPSLTINDVSLNEGNSGTTTFNFTVSLSTPAPAGGVSFDIATQDGTATTANNAYVARSLTAQSIPAGQTSYTFDVTVNGDTLVESNETFFVNISNVSANASVTDGQGLGTIQNDDSASLVISQVYGGGNNTGATYQNDFVELYNRGTATVDFSVTPYSIQYAGVGSNFSTSNKTNLTSGTIAPGRYFLVKEGGGTANGIALPTPDATDTILMGNSAGKIALVVGTNALTPANTCPGDDGSSPFNASNAAIADFVGYGNTATTAGHCYEGPGPASAPSNTTSDFRKAGGCTDTDNNAADFFVTTPFPRNSTSPVNNCAAGATPNLTINDVTLAEGNSGTTTATFTVSLSAPAQGGDVTFDIATQNGTALSGSDYVAHPLTNQVIPAGQTTYTFEVTINGDTTIEPDENFLVNVTKVAGATVIDGQGVGTIQHDDLPTLSIDDVAPTAEGDGGTKVFTFHVTLSAPAPANVTFDIATADGTAQDGTPGGEDNDYQAHSIIGQTIAQGISSVAFDVTVNGDMVIEPNETFFVNVTNVSGATLLDGQGLGTMQNDDSPALSIDDATANEGLSGATTFTFHVTLSLPAGPGGVSFDIATADGTAQDHNPISEDNDYVANSTNHTISAGQSSYDFAVTVNGDSAPETNETFTVNVTNVTGATVTDGTGWGTIVNDDGAPLVISQLYGGGGNSGATLKNDFIEIYNRSSSTISLSGYSVQYASDTGTSWLKTDLTNVSLASGKYYLIQEALGAGGTVNLPTPDATGSIAMTTDRGKVALVSNTTLLSGSCPSSANILDLVGYGATAACFEGSGAAPAPSNTTADARKGGGCVDTDNNAADFFLHSPAPRNTASPANVCGGQSADISINDMTVTEGNSGTISANFTVSLAAPSASTITVDYATANGSAIEPGDYTVVPNTQLTFLAGETSKPVSVLVKGDTIDEPDETFFLNLSNPTNAAILDSQGQGTITDDDVPPTLTINDVALNEGNSPNTTFFHFVVSLSAPALNGGVTFDIATQDGTATTADSDYVANSQTSQTITEGNSTFAFDVTVNGDGNIETNETFLVNVTNIVGGTAGDPQGQGTILNDDSPALTIDDVTVIEGSGGTTNANFTVTLSPTSTQTVTVDYATSSTVPSAGTAAAGTDYTVTSGTLTFTPGVATQTITVPVIGDTNNEAICETYFVNLSNAVNANTSDPTGNGGITDDDGNKVVISQVYGGGNNAGAPYRNDFIEIFNRGNTAVSLNGWSVQYTSDTGAGTWSVTNLTNVSLQPGQYYLVQEAGGTTNGVVLPTPDMIGTIAMAAGAGKVALVNNTTALTGSCPSSATIIDFVGYGTTATCREGSTITDNAPAPSNTLSDLRKLSGCQDKNLNSTDFATGAPNPRNTAAATNSCSCSTSYF